MRKTFIAIALVALVALVAGPATAGGRGGARGTGGSVRFSSDHVVVGSTYQVIGTGFRPNTWISVGARYSTTFWASGPTNGEGAFVFTMTARETGEITHDTYKQGNNGQWRLATTSSLTVYQT